MMLNTKRYSSKDIKVLSDMEAIRTHPGIYIGDTTVPNHLFKEVFDNSIDEFMAGYATEIYVELIDLESVLVRDNGRGLPIDNFPGTEYTGAEIIFIRTHSGGKFNRELYRESGGLHGVGLSAVNALSNTLSVRIFHDDKLYDIEFSKGEIKSRQTEKENKTEYKRGTEITLRSDPTIFETSAFDLFDLEEKIYDAAAVNSGIRIVYYNRLKDERRVYSGMNINDYIRSESKELLLKNNIEFNGEIGEIRFQICMNWIKDFKEDKIVSFTNSIRQKDGGTHVNGLKNGMIRFFTTEIARRKNVEAIPQYSDFRPGFIAVISIKMHHPRFDTQTKHRLISPEARIAIDNYIYSAFSEVRDIEDILLMVENNIYSRLLSKHMQNKNKTGKFAALLMEGRLLDCRTTNKNEAEIILVEGKSAANTAGQCRDPERQAVFVLGGKILNVSKTNLDRVLESEIVTSIVSALSGTFQRNGTVHFKNLKYSKIILMTDADFDGRHIRTLLLALFHKYMRDLIEKGYLYVVCPPLYRLNIDNNTTTYFNLQEDYINFISRYIAEKSLPRKNAIENTKITSIINLIIRFKELQSRPMYSYLIDALVYSHIYSYEDLRIDLKLNKLKEYLAHSLNLFYILEHKNMIEIESIRFMDKITLDDNFFTVRSTYSQIIDLLFEQIDDERGLPILIKKTRDIFGEGLISIICRHYLTVQTHLNVQMFKGLGEMNPEQLFETSMDASKRNLKQIYIEDSTMAAEIVNLLMGEDVEARRKFIMERL